MRGKTWISLSLAVVAFLAATIATPVGVSAQDAGSGGGAAAPVPAQAPPPTLPTPPLQPLVRNVLPDSKPGREALASLSAGVLATVAAQNGQSVEALTRTLSKDSSAWLDKDGMLLFLDPPAPAQYLTNEPPAPGPFPNGNTFFLHSKPGSNRVLYLDFDGYSLPAGTNWRGGAAYTALPWDTDGNGANWSQSEIDTIQGVWQRVSEDYAPFDIDITTQDPGYAAINRSSALDTVFGTRVVITDSPNSDFCSCGGVAYVGNIDSIGAAHDAAQPAWAFATGVGDGVHNLAEVSSHESGHNVGLSHDGQTPSTQYYAGHGLWAPIMGNSYGRPVTQWSRGEYAGANNTEDDYAIAGANSVALIGDEAGCAIAATDALVQNATRVVASQGDCDAFRYDAPCSGTYTVSAEVASVSPDLSLQMNLWNWNGAFIANSSAQPVFVNSDVVSGMGETATLAMTAGQAYTIAVFPLANGTASTGWTDYGNRGRYSIRVNTPCGNDAFGAQTIGGPFDTRTANNSLYTVQAGEPNPTCGDTGTGSTNTAWWSWTAPGTGTATFDTVGSDFDTVLSAYTGSVVNGLTQVACNDDFSGLQSRVTFAATAGTTYRLQVDGFGTAKGNIRLTTTGCLPVNNNTFACANTLTSNATGGGTATGSNVGYTGEGGEPVPACGFIPSQTSAWWNWTAPGTGSFSLDTFGSTFDTVLGVYTGTSVNALAAVTCNDDSGGIQSKVTFNATAGTTYRIQVNGYNAGTGNITLNVVDNRPVLALGVGAVYPEGTTGQQTVANVPLTLSAASAVPITVNWSTLDVPGVPGYAHPPGDYTAASGVLTFLPGETSKTVPVTVLGDTLHEPPFYFGEWAFVQLTTVSPEARVSTGGFFGLGIVVIIDDDP